MKLVVVILDGWGHSSDKRGNAISAAYTPNWDQLWAQAPHSLLTCHGESVGLPDGAAGSSELGHLHLGAGRVVWQERTRIDNAIRQKTLAINPILQEAIQRARSTRLHLFGLLSDGGIHAHTDHLKALLDLARGGGVHHICIHAFTDGRDAPPEAGKIHVRRLRMCFRPHGVGGLATLSGRSYAMDRDARWERTRKVWSAMVLGKGHFTTDPEEYLSDSYSNGIPEEALPPAVVQSGKHPLGTVQEGDVLLCWNFRGDRSRQICQALGMPDFSAFPREESPHVHLVTLTAYGPGCPFPACFPPQDLRRTFGEVLAAHGLKNLRLAESEKFTHLTLYFNGGREAAWPGERRLKIPSPRVATYDLKPEMSAPEITDRLLDELKSGEEEVILVNYSNGDMVGHTGIWDAAQKAAESVDRCLGRILEAVRAQGHILVVTSDHGNLESMTDNESGGPHTSHTANPVPFIVLHPKGAVDLAGTGTLASVAPTLLDLLGLPRPAEMTEPSLLQV